MVLRLKQPKALAASGKWCGGGPVGAAPATGDRSPRGRIAGTAPEPRYFVEFAQRVFGSSPYRNVAQSPLIDCSSNDPPPKVSPMLTL